MKAYNELVGNILEDEDRIKFEWIIGAVLTGAPPRTMVIAGPSGSGKTTLTDIVRKLLSEFQGEISPRVAFHRDLVRPGRDYDPEVFNFVECLDPVSPKWALYIETTGGMIPVNKYHVLMRQIIMELDSLADFCIERYRALGVYHY